MHRSHISETHEFAGARRAVVFLEYPEDILGVLKLLVERKHLIPKRRADVVDDSVEILRARRCPPDVVIPPDRPLPDRPFDRHAKLAIAPVGREGVRGRCSGPRQNREVRKDASGIQGKRTYGDPPNLTASRRDDPELQDVHLPICHSPDRVPLALGEAACAEVLPAYRENFCGFVVDLWDGSWRCRPRWPCNPFRQSQQPVVRKIVDRSCFRREVTREAKDSSA